MAVTYSSPDFATKNQVDELIQLAVNRKLVKLGEMSLEEALTDNDPVIRSLSKFILKAVENKDK
jgi:hypothetical protein